MVSRRAVLGGAIAAGIGAPFVTSAFFSTALAAFSTALAADGLPLTVVNDTRRFPNDRIFLYIVGTDPKTGEQGFVRSGGTLTPCRSGRPALQFPAGWVATDPSFPVLHDCVEFTFNDAGMFCNRRREG